MVEEVRQRRREAKDRQQRGEATYGDGWTEAHIDALLEEIDRLRAITGETAQ
jgi:hypothetical protein